MPLRMTYVGLTAHVQVRRSSYHDVVKVAEISRHLDLSEVQPYVINGAKVVFLKRRPQPKAPRGTNSNYACSMCGRHLQVGSSTAVTEGRWAGRGSGCAFWDGPPPCEPARSSRSWAAGGG